MASQSRGGDDPLPRDLDMQEATTASHTCQEVICTGVKGSSSQLLSPQLQVDTRMLVRRCRPYRDQWGFLHSATLTLAWHFCGALGRAPMTTGPSSGDQGFLNRRVLPCWCLLLLIVSNATALMDPLADTPGCTLGGRSFARSLATAGKGWWGATVAASHSSGCRDEPGWVTAGVREPLPPRLAAPRLWRLPRH